MKAMKYKRLPNGSFSLGRVIYQVAMWSQENKTKPDKILLPPEEYWYYLHFLDGKMKAEETNLFGIPVEMYYDEQETYFSI